jgi:hypothetical protein
MKNTVITLSFLFALFASAQDKKQQDIKSIKSMCGCYEVEFNFTETFKYSKDANYQPSKTKKEYGLEWVELVEDAPNRLVMQHLLIVDTMIIKHWRQDWIYENNKLYDFYKDKTWKFKTLPKNDVKGQWTQKVYQVDDSPRYEGNGTWIHADGRDYWTSTANAPLPRREYTARNDYNVLKRTNTHEITKEGWIHDQDNVKIIRGEDGKDVVLAKEKGNDVYTKVDDSRCKLATAYWAKNKIFWKNVRDNWETIYARNQDLNLQPKVDGKQLYEYLFDLKPDTPKAVSDQIINSFVK